MESHNIGDKIKEKRKLLGYSQEKLAELSSLSLRTIQRLEKGHHPTGDTLTRLSESLSIDITELTNNNGQKSNRSFIKFSAVFIAVGISLVFVGSLLKILHIPGAS